MGSTEIEKIMYGSSLVWESLKFVDLGTAQTFDIKNYSENWRNLTADNFFIVGNSNSTYISGNEGGDEIVYVYDSYSKSYNASTGILSCYIYVINDGSYQYASVHCALVEKKEKLIYLGEGKSFNVTGYTGYSNFTYKNFLMSRPNYSSGSWKEIGGVRTPEQWNAYSQIQGSYSNGVFTCQYYGEYNHQNTHAGTPRTRSDSMVVYLFPKKIS